MKKIYMILAAITLLSMSLNAQTRATENVTDHIVASAFTATTTTYTNFSGVTFTSDAVYAGNSALDNGTNIQLRSSNSNSGIVTTTSGGKIKSITITVARGTNEIEVYVKNSAYSSASDLYNNSTRGTRLGRYSTSTTINVTDDYEYLGIRSRNGAIYLSSIDVVWEREVDDPNTATLDLFSNTTDANMCLPVYGGYHDHTQHNQMVYPASLLTDMVGKKIKSMTFYPASVTYNGTTYSGIGFRNGSVTFKLMEVTNSTGFNSSNPSFITGSMTTVKTVTMPSSAQTSATTWKITFDQEYEYNGGDLVIDVTNATGDYQRTYFYTGTTSIAYPGYYTYSGSEGNASVAVDYVPKVTFTYDNTTTASITITPETQTINDATPGSLTVTGTDIEGNINVSAGTNWSVDPTSLSSTGGSVSVSYTGTDLSASTTVTASATGATDATATVNYVADLYIVTDNGVTGNWDFTNGTHMTYDNGVYTATFTATADNTFILFARMLGNNVDWNTRYVFGPDSNGDWWLNGDSGNGTIDTDDDDPIKIVNSGVYVVTINANDGTFTITKAKTADPVITYTVNGDNVVITATGDGTVTLTANGQTVSGNGSASITVPRTNVDQNVTATATAQETGKTVSNTVTENITVPALPAPELTAPTDGATVNVGTNTGSGVSTTITVSGQGLTSDLTVSVSGEGFSVSPTTITAADANAGTTITVTYNGYNENATGTLTITSSNGEVSTVTVNLTASYNATPIEPKTGLLRLHMLLVDQLKANIPDDNTHADAYRYVLKYEPAGGETKQSNNVDVEIQKTECEVKGYYTKAEIDGDTDGTLTMNVLTADVQFNLSDDNDEIEFYDLQGKAREYPALGEDYLTKLQRTTNFTYVEMLDGSDDYGHEYPNGEHHYYDDSTPILTGTYSDANSFMSYAPSLSTWGIQRRYFEDDGLDNTYGAPIWRTRVGQVQIQGKPAMQRQVKSTNDNSPNPYTSWTVDNTVYNLYFLGVNAEALLPNTEGTYGTNINYEPYMFRVFVESPTGKLRKFDRVQGEGGGYYTVDAGPVDGKYCVGSFLVDDGWHANDLFFSKTIPSANSMRAGGDDQFDPNAWDGIMKFGAVDGISKDDIKVYVRFYYMTEGWDTRDGEARPGNGAEGSGDPDDPGTYIYELVGNGEIVGVTYVNAQGMTSDKPFDGLNIVITRYSDGSTITTKVLR